MSDFLSQEEIDALLKAGLGKGAEQEEESEEDSSQPQAQQHPPYEQQDFDEQPYQQAPSKKTKLRHSSKIDEPINVQPAEFDSFDEEEMPTDATNLEVILNLDLEIRVELGTTQSTVRKVLEMGSGSVIELQKLNGEPVDLLINKKPFAKGEMIVIGENFGVRVTDIDSIQEIIEALR